MKRIIMPVTGYHPADAADNPVLTKNNHDQHLQKRLDELRTEYIDGEADLRAVVHRVQLAFRHGK